MKRGISPIVAVVLLIAIAVIAAVGLYFWVGSLTGKQATPSTPGMITANVICNETKGGTSTVLITNIGTQAIDPSKLTATKGTLQCPTGSINSGETVKCNITNFGQGDGTATIYGNNIGAISITC